MRRRYSSIVIIFAGIILFNILWPLIKFIAVLALIAAVVFGIYVYFESRKVQKEISQDPQTYFTQQLNNQREKQTIASNVIDAEYKEKEITEEND